ncbi:hypothetical protein BDV96DRAFT_616989 [Lophiotrema nucula]|uniref:Uncharacterized protein n=1 Tax=Lophiotrema nucula TaxID=690887 RepID=A0A6A5YLS9_9PLEO|nr:hypothetical protein BDV96DRAFT_616989 [Lophiotrema nucula]
MAPAEKTISTDRLSPPFVPREIPPKPHRAAVSASQASLLNGDINPLPVLDTATNIPLTPFDSLPTIFTGKDGRCELAGDDIKSFLKKDLDLKRLNRIHGHLWMAGRPLRARPLHRYKMEGFDLLYTQQMDLHLLKFSNKLIVKPLPEWILDHSFWEKYMCDSQELHEAAAGFLVSYVWLLCSPLDLKLAHDHGLLPSFITWHWWKEFVADFYQHIDMNALDQVNKRYNFGDLRLGRINSIYRIRYARTHFVRGYLYGYNRYVVFFQRKFSWILIVFVFFSLVLSAMQVGLGVDPLKEDTGFARASYGFVVFSMVSVVLVLGSVGAIFFVVFFYNMVAAIAHDKRAHRERRALAKNRKDDLKTA